MSSAATSKLIGKVILVVEDIPDTLAGTVAELKSSGIDIDLASSVGEALEKMKNKKYGAVLLAARV